MDFIERENARNDLLSVTNDITCPLHIAAELEQILDLIPAADVAPIRHGRWIDRGGFGSLYNGFIPEYKCSVCNNILHSKRSYCGNCGAKMDGGEGKCEK